jgi:predicted  nucleic acid-binding Zn-ribbon protein
MSTVNAKKESKGVAMTLVSKIAAFLKLGDEGKLQSFMDRIIRDSNREVTRLTQNLSTEEISHKHTIEKLNDDLADAKQALEDAFMNVDVTRISTNADQDSYKTTYLGGIEKAERNIDIIEDKIADAKASLMETKKQITEQINAYKARIASFEGK